MEEQKVMSIEFNLNKFFESYSKEDFMKSVLIKFLKENPDIVAKALASYVVMDLVKSNQMETISKGVSDIINKELSDVNVSTNLGIRQATRDLCSKLVVEKKSTLDFIVTQTINSEVTKQNILQNIQKFIERKLMKGFNDLGEDE